MLRASTIVAIATGLLLVVLGHDVIMAAGPHDAGGQRARVAHQERASDALSDGWDAVPALDGLLLSATQACGTMEGMRQPATPDIEPGAPDLAAMFWAQDGEELRGIAPRWWQEPEPPPAVRRALLQVFLN